MVRHIYKVKIGEPALMGELFSKNEVYFVNGGIFCFCAPKKRGGGGVPNGVPGVPLRRSDRGKTGLKSPPKYTPSFAREPASQR